MEHLVVPGSLDQLSTIRSFVDRAAAAAGLERRAAYRLRLAVDEIATNIINYGYEREGLSGDIRLSAAVDGDWLRVSLEDDGLEYDPTTAEAPKDLDQPLEQRGIGGLGIFLTLRGVDDFRYRRVGGHNVSTFGMRRPAGADQAQP
jgi:serine/threonine-protein kinase RsbW